MKETCELNEAEVIESSNIRKSTIKPPYSDYEDDDDGVALRHPYELYTVSDTIINYRTTQNFKDPTPLLLRHIMLLLAP